MLCRCLAALTRTVGPRSRGSGSSMSIWQFTQERYVSHTDINIYHTVTLTLPAFPQRLYQCEVANCGRRFKRKSHLSSHMLRHTGVKQFKWVTGSTLLTFGFSSVNNSSFIFFRCDFTDCMKSFFDVRKLKRHVEFVHGDENCCKVRLHI